MTWAEKGERLLQHRWQQRIKTENPEWATQAVLQHNKHDASASMEPGRYGVSDVVHSTHGPRTRRGGS